MFVYQSPSDKSYLLATDWKEKRQIRVKGTKVWSSIAVYLFFLCVTPQQKPRCRRCQPAQLERDCCDFHTINRLIWKANQAEMNANISLRASLILLDREGCDSLALDLSARGAVASLMCSKLGSAFMFRQPRLHLLAHQNQTGCSAFEQVFDDDMKVGC